ncbi:unnamed protein product [Moneuplotes crassus]|uniref:Uncharacterized protein n=1 Tax=Euplotes crassus TaxID=5936 RepID=A0AAD2CXT5_EUPCR|nr:unnamed protein product [Moneuplotes crassus]
MEISIDSASDIASLSEDSRDNCIIYKVYLGMLVFLSVITVVLTCWWTTKFLLIFKTRKKLTTLFLFLLTLSSIARLGYFIMEIVWRQGNCSSSPSRCGEAPVYWLSSTLFSSAVVVNIFNWVYQTLRMKKFITGVRQKQILCHIIFATLSGIVLLAYLIFVISVCALARVDVILARIFTLIYAITFFLIGLIFIFIGWRFYKEFKKFYEDKTKAIRNRVFMSILVISTTFILKGIVNVAYYWADVNIKFRSEWLKQNAFWYPLLLLVYFGLTEILPTAFLCMGIRNIYHQIERKKEIEPSYNLAMTTSSTESLADTYLSNSVVTINRVSMNTTT